MEKNLRFDKSDVIILCLHSEGKKHKNVTVKNP